MHKKFNGEYQIILTILDKGQPQPIDISLFIVKGSHLVIKIFVSNVIPNFLGLVLGFGDQMAS